MHYLEKDSEKNKIIIKNDFKGDLDIKFSVKKISFKIYYHIREQNITQKELAERMKVSPQNISKMLKGDDFKTSTLAKFERALGIKLLDRDILPKEHNDTIVIELKKSITRKKMIGNNISHFRSDKLETIEIYSLDIDHSDFYQLETII